MAPTAKLLRLGLPTWFVLSTMRIDNPLLVPMASAFLPCPNAWRATMPLVLGEYRSFSPAQTALFMGTKRKPSMAERRKRRAKRTPPKVAERPAIWDELSPTDSWGKTEPTGAAPTPSKDARTYKIVDAEDAATEQVKQEVASEARSLVDSQRRSVDCLTFIRKRVEESFPVADAAKSLSESGYFVHDGFLSGDNGGDGEINKGNDFLAAMLAEGSSMLSKDLLELDVTRIGDGEYVGTISGGKRYIDCPRLTEYVVSLTRHLPPLLNEQTSDGGDAALSQLDASASMGSLRMYDRKARLKAESLLKTEAESSSSRPFGVVCDDNDGTESDNRRLTALLFLVPKEWDASSCGGGITEEGQPRLDAVCDRLVLLRSDTCVHRQETWLGSDEEGMDRAGCVAVHFVGQRS